MNSLGSVYCLPATLVLRLFLRFRCSKINYNFILLNLRELPITDKELILIATAANIGDNNIPNNGNNTPAAIGMPSIL
jgi:hypothetical protein